MTWKEFKAEVDRQLEKVGLDEEIEFDYIDTTGNFSYEEEDIRAFMDCGRLVVY